MNIKMNLRRTNLMYPLKITKNVVLTKICYNLHIFADIT